MFRSNEAFKNDSESYRKEIGGTVFARFLVAKYISGIAIQVPVTAHKDFTWQLVIQPDMVCRMLEN